MWNCKFYTFVAHLFTFFFHDKGGKGASKKVLGEVAEEREHQFSSSGSLQLAYIDSLVYNGRM